VYPCCIPQQDGFDFSPGTALRVRVGQIFGAQAKDMGVTIGMIHAGARIGMKTLACSMRRLVQLPRTNPCPA
jgi:hypothetical protein